MEKEEPPRGGEKKIPREQSPEEIQIQERSSDANKHQKDDKNLQPQIPEDDIVMGVETSTPHKAQGKKKRGLEKVYSSVACVPYDPGKTIFQNMQKILEPLQRYIEQLQERVFEIQKRQRNEIPTTHISYLIQYTQEGDRQHTLSTTTTIQELHSTTDSKQVSTQACSNIQEATIPSSSNLETTKTLSSTEVQHTVLPLSRKEHKAEESYEDVDDQTLLENISFKYGRQAHIKSIIASTFDGKDEKKPIFSISNKRENIITQVIKAEKEAIHELETLQQLQLDNQLHTTVLCTLDKQDFEEFRKNKPKNWVIIQLVNSRKSIDRNIIAFYVIPTKLIYPDSQTGEHTEEATHLYWDDQKFWNIDLDNWDLQGKFELQGLPVEQRKTTIQKQVKIHPEAQHNKLFIHSSTLTKGSEEYLRKLIDMFERKQRTQGKKDVRVFIGIQGTTSTAKKSVQKLLKQFKHPEILQNRVVHYKNLKQYTQKLDVLSVTHVVEDRLGYITKAQTDGVVIRKCILMKPKHDSNADNAIKQVQGWEQAVEEIKATSLDIDLETHVSPLPAMVENYVHEGGYTHEGGDIKFVFWNMNSLRNVHITNFLTEFLLNNKADFIGITELRGSVKDTITIKHLRSVLRQAGYAYTYFNTATPNAGLYGTAIFSKIQPEEIVKNIGVYKEEGRSISAIFKDFIIVLSYTPTLGMNEAKEFTQVERRTTYDEYMTKHLQELRTKYSRPIILAGDLNTIIHKHHIWNQDLIDKMPSATERERQVVLQIMKDHTLVDSYDSVKETAKNFTYFFSKKEGMKIDHILIPQEWMQTEDNTKPQLIHAGILRTQKGSDHLPVEATIRFPKTYKFRRQATPKRVHNLSVMFYDYTNTPTFRGNEVLSPLMFKGAHNKSQFTNNILTTCTWEDIKQLIEVQQQTQEVELDKSELNKIQRESSEQRQEDNQEFKSWIPHILVQMARKEIQKQAMVDTGANHNIINIQTLKHLKQGTEQALTPVNIQFTVGDAHTVPVLGQVTLEFYIEGTRFVENFYVMERSNFGILLGSVFCHKHKVNVNYEHSTMTIKEASTRTTVQTRIFQKLEQGQNPTYPVTCTEDTLVKQGGITAVPAKLSNKHRELFANNQFGVIEKSSQLLGMHGCATSVGFTFLPEQTQVMNILVLNCTGEDITIPRNTEVAKFIPCEVEQFTEGGLGLPVDLGELMTPKRQPKHNTSTCTNITNTKEVKDAPTSEATEPNLNDRESTNTTETHRGFKNVKAAQDIPDFTDSELEEIFSRPGLRDMIPNLQIKDMSVPQGMTEEKLKQLKQLIAKRVNCWSKNDKDPRHVKHYSVHIPHDNNPSVERLRPYTAAEVEEWKKQVQVLIDSKTVEESNSPWRSASFLVKKPTGGYRFVTDYRKANLHVPKMHWPLVRIESALSALGNANVISSCDACAAYHQIPLADESSKQWTSFAGPTCQLQYTTLPMGYRNSVSEYSRFTSYVLGNLMWQCCLTYLDDFLIWSETFEQHLLDLDSVLCRIEYYGIQFSAKKSLFCRSQLLYLGHIITPGKGISPNPAKVKAIEDMPQPKNKKELTTFLQSLSFYRRMIPLFNRLSEPLRQKTNTKKWSPMTEIEADCFYQLKKSLIEAPVLAIPNLNPDTHPFYIITDASKQGLGAILMQMGEDKKLHPLSYISRMTEDKEKQRYTTYQLEMGAIVWALQVFKPYLRHKKIPFILRTDCQSLCWLMKTDHDSAVKKWIFELTEFDFTIEYLKGTDNPADVLSRLPLPVPQGYFNEQPLEPLYSEDHSKLMQYIIDVLNKRAEKKRIKPVTSLTNPTLEVNQITLQQSRYTCTCEGVGAELCTLQEFTCTHQLRKFLQETFTEQVNVMRQKIQRANYKAEINCFLNVSQTRSMKRQVRRQEEAEQKQLPQVVDEEQTQEQEENFSQEQDHEGEGKREAREQELERITRNIIHSPPDSYDEDENLGQIDDDEMVQDHKEEVEEVIPFEQQLEIIRTQFNNENFREWQESSSKIQKITTKLTVEEDQTQPIHNLYKLSPEDGILYINNRELQKKFDHHKGNKKIIRVRNEWSKYVPDTVIPGTTLGIKWYILREFHGYPTSGHLGVNSTYFLIRQHFYWPGMISDVRRWITSCIPCQKRKVGKNVHAGEHKSILQSRPFEIVSIDLVGPFPKTPEGYTHVLTCIDHFTRYPIAVPIKGKSMEIVASALKTNLFMAFPFWPRKILSDKGTEFVNKIVQEVYKQLKVKQVLTSHDNPQANQVERFHRYMNAAISIFLEKKHHHGMWDQYLDAAVYVYRCTTNHATGHSPFYALYGRHPIRPLDHLMTTQIEEQKFADNTEYAKAIVETFREAYEEIHKNQVHQSIRNMKHNENKEVKYNVGDFVYSWRKHDPQKLDWRYHGPYQIVEKITAQTYKLKTGQYKSGPEKGKDKFKQVTVRHLRHYNPFDDDIGDTSPSLVEDEQHTDSKNQPQQEVQQNHNKNQQCELEEENQETLELKEGMMVIIPFWGWSDIREEDKFCAAKVVGFRTIKQKHVDQRFTIVHRYGNDNANFYHALKPAYIRAKKRGDGTEFTHTKKPQVGDIPYTNYIQGTVGKKTVNYDYFIEDKNIIYRGYTLTMSGKLPDSILQKISKNPWLTDGKQE